MSVTTGKSFIKLTAGQSPRLLMLKLGLKLKLELMLDLESVAQTKNASLHQGSSLK
jgi:hypothetical protein